jgi:acetyl esterase/lipase
MVMTTNPSLIAENDIPYGTGGGRDLLLDILRPDVPAHPLRPAVIWVHGGGWREGSRADSPNAMLARRGFVTASISYRLVDEAIFPAQIHDVKAAIRFLRANAPRWGIDPERIGIWGHSAGGHLAALAAVSEGIPALEGDGGSPDESSDVQAAVPMAPPTDFLVDWFADSGFPHHEDAWGAVENLLNGLDLDDPETSELARIASPARIATAGAPPILVVHGTLDDLVPVGQGRVFVNALLERGVDASLLELPHDDHGLGSVYGEDPVAVTPAGQEIIDFFVRTLGPVEWVENAG